MSEQNQKISIWKNPPRGFRMMWWDPIAILICAAAVWFGWEVFQAWILMVPYVLGTFFLFCNVFRVRQNLELIWAAIFIANTLAWLYFAPSLLGIVVTQSIVTIVVIAYHARTPGYRGIFSSAS